MRGRGREERTDGMQNGEEGEEEEKQEGRGGRIKSERAHTLDQ